MKTNFSLVDAFLIIEHFFNIIDVNIRNIIGILFMKISRFFVSGFFIAGSLVITIPSLASCYDSEYARYCVGVEGPDATYSSRGDYFGF